MKKILSILAVFIALTSSVFALETFKNLVEVNKYLAATPVVSQEQLDAIKEQFYKNETVASFNKKIVVPMLATGKSDAVYQTLFKEYVFDLAKSSNYDARKVVENELKVFVAVCDENSADQINWLNRLRLFNAVYAELQ